MSPINSSNSKAKNSGDLGEIKKTKVSFADIANFESEDEFTELGFYLLKETAMLCNFTSRMMGDSNQWPLKKAIVGGNLVRIYKLTQSILLLVSEKQTETSLALCRMVFESCVNVKYFTRFYSKELEKQYFKSGFVFDKRLLDLINKKVAQNEGRAEPIEHRMISSINTLFAENGLTSDEINASNKFWGKHQDFASKLAAVDLTMAYDSLFRNTSSAVHGDWGDLFRHHLSKVEDSKFTPNLRWTYPRPQFLFALSIIILDTLIDAKDFLCDGLHVEDYDEHVVDLLRRVSVVDSAHEDFLQNFRSTS